MFERGGEVSFFPLIFWEIFRKTEKKPFTFQFFLTLKFGRFSVKQRFSSVWYQNSRNYFFANFMEKKHKKKIFTFYFSVLFIIFSFALAFRETIPKALNKKKHFYCNILFHFICHSKSAHKKLFHKLSFSGF